MSTAFSESEKIQADPLLNKDYNRIFEIRASCETVKVSMNLLHAMGLGIGEELFNLHLYRSTEFLQKIGSRIVQSTEKGKEGPVLVWGVLQEQ